MPVRVEKSDWERVPVNPVTVGTGRGCVSDEMSEEVEADGWADVLLTDKAAREAPLDLVKNECRSLAGKSVCGDAATVTATLGTEAVTICQVMIDEMNKLNTKLNTFIP